MSKITMKAFQMTEMSFANKLVNGKQIKLDNNYSYNVKYAPNNTCKGELTVNISDKDAADKFYIKMTVVGVFAFEEGTPKEKIHVETFKEVFPYARSLIITMTSNAGIPPIIIPSIDIEAQSIYVLGTEDPNGAK